MITEDIILENEFIVYSIINKYLNYFDKDDLYQVGMIGLINAFNNYKGDRNTKFSSYAYFYVKGEVTKYIRESNVLKISKSLIELNKSIEKAKILLTGKLGYVPSNREISLFLDIDEKQLEDALNANELVASLDSENDSDVNLYNKLSFEEKSYKEELIDLRNELAKLNSFEKDIINKRYNEGLTQSEVSRELGINQVKVSRCENKILTKLKTRLN